MSLYKLPFTTESLHGLVAVVSLTAKPFRRDSSVGVLPACRAALLNYCHSRHVASDSTRPRLKSGSGFVIRERSFGPVGAHARATLVSMLHAPYAHAPHQTPVFARATAVRNNN